MKNLSIVCLAVLLLITASCNKEELSNETMGLYTFTGVVEDNTPSTRVGFDLNNNGSFFWNTGDAIAVGASSFAKYTTNCNDKSTSATFTSLSPASGYAVYPWDRAQSISGSELTYEFENEYNYTTVDADFFNGMSVDMPLWAKVEGSTLSFKHLGGILAFKFPNLKAGDNQVFTLTAESKISGIFTADLSVTEPEFITSNENVQDTDKKVTINFSLASDADAVFYVPVPVGIYSLKVEITNGAESHLQEYKNLEVKRRQIRYTTLSSHSLQGSEASVVNTPSDVTSAMDDNTNVILSDITSAQEKSTVSIELPKKTTDSGVVHSLSIGSIDANTETIEIKEDETDNDGSSISELVISVPTTADAKKLVINMPNTTVSILVNGMNALSLSEVTASTADNTLVIGKGVTIDTLNVEKGNVRIEEGGNVKEIIRASENTETVYVVYESATAPEIELGNGVLLISQAEFDLMTTINNGGEVTLTSDIVLTTSMKISEGKTVVINLNGHTISQTKECTGSYSMFENKGTLTIKDTSYEGDGKISFQDLSDGGDDTWGTYIITNTGTLVVENGTLVHLGTADNDFDTNLPIQNYTGKVTINGGKISSQQFRSVRDFTAGGEIIINGGVFEGQVWMQGLGTGSSSLTINGGEFAPTANDGSSVFITNNTNDVIVSINGGKFKTKIGCTDATKEGVNGCIKGGIFTTSAKENTNKALIAEGIEFVETENDYWVIEKSYEKTSETSYTIYSANGMKWLAEQVNSGQNTFEGTTIMLGSDIDLKNENWTPIGFNTNDEAGNEPYFSGTFDGNNHTINNLKIDVTDKGGVGLFGAVHNATFKNFTLNNVDIKAIESENNPANSSGAEDKPAYIVGGHTGAIAGYDAKPGTLNFENVHVTGLIKIEGETRAAQGQRIGGIFGGRSSSKVNFSNVSVKGSDGSYIKGYCSTAGVMGQNQGIGTFTNVQTDIDIYAVTFGTGGIIGIALKGSTFTNCSSAGDITLDASKTQLSSYSANYPYRVGGIAGCWSESNTGVLTLTSCSYNGTLTSIDKDGNKVNLYDYAGYVGRGYSLNGCQGSKVIVNGVSYVQACNTAALAGIYIVDDVYEIGTTTAFKWFANEVNTGSNYFDGKTVKLTNDIDLNNEEWTPIGSISQEHGFMGNFDGNGKTIKNLEIANITPDSDGYVYAGLFGITEGTESDENYIKNLTIENVNISTDGNIVAAAIAYPSYTTVEDIIVKGDVEINGGDYTAGILAYTRRCYNAKNLVITANSASAITGEQTVGGVISDIQSNGGLVNYSNFKASGLIITGKKCVGGISGIISTQTLDGATVENVSIKCNDVRKGIVSGALGGKSTIKNIIVNNVTGADKVVGATYDGKNDVIVNGDIYEKAETNN